MAARTFQGVVLVIGLFLVFVAIDTEGWHKALEAGFGTFALFALCLVCYGAGVQDERDRARSGDEESEVPRAE